MLQERRGLAVERRRTSDGIVDYFANEIMAKASAETQAILLETAFLARFSGAMAETLTGRPDAGGILARLHREGCFLLQHAEPHAVYEYQPLFRAFLLRRAYAALATTRRAEIQRMAAGLLEREGRVAEAVELLRQAGDWAELARLVEATTRTAEDSADGRRVDQWIAALPAETVAERPWLLFRRGVSRLADQPAAARDDFAAVLPLFRKAGDAGGAFLAWARAVETFPYQQADFSPLDEADQFTETEALQPPEQGFVVLFQDLRFTGTPRSITRRPGRGALSKAVELDKNLHVVGDVYDTEKGRIVVPEPGQR